MSTEGGEKGLHLKFLENLFAELEALARIEGGSRVRECLQRVNNSSLRACFTAGRPRRCLKANACGEERCESAQVFISRALVVDGASSSPECHCAAGDSACFKKSVLRSLCRVYMDGLDARSSPAAAAPKDNSRTTADDLPLFEKMLCFLG